MASKRLQGRQAVENGWTTCSRDAAHVVRCRVQPIRSAESCPGNRAALKETDRCPPGVLGLNPVPCCTPPIARDNFCSPGIMMSTHYSLLMRDRLLRTRSMVSASVSASFFCSGLALGYALRAWRARRTLANLFPTASRASARPAPISTFGHTRRAF